LIRTTAAQKDEIRKAIKSNKFYRIEKVWTFLVADILSNSLNRNHYIELFCNKEIEIDTYLDIWYEIKVTFRL
jgi:flagellar biosynthesis regulator FlaF